MLKGISRVGLVAFSGLLVACAGGVRAETNPKSPTAGVASADPLKARELIRDSEKALMKKKFDKARDLLRQAEPFADPSVRDEIREMSDRVDKADAKSLVGDANEEAKDGKCGRALDDTAALVNMKGKGPGFPDFVREFTLEANQACLVGMAESPDKLRDARLLGGTQNAKEALGPKVYAALQAGYAALQAGEEKQQQERAAGNRELWLESAPERCAAALNKGYCSKAPDGTTEAESARCNTACAEAMQKGFQSRVQSALEVCGDGYVETDGKRVACEISLPNANEISQTELAEARASCEKSCSEEGPKLLAASKKDERTRQTAWRHVVSYKQCMMAVDQTVQARRYQAYDRDLYLGLMTETDSRCRKAYNCDWVENNTPMTCSYHY